MVWFAQAYNPVQAWRIEGRIVLAVLLIGLSVGKIVRVGKIDSQAVILENPGIVSAVDTRVLEKECDGLLLDANAHKADLLVFLTDKTGTYGCGALLYGKMETFFPQYERRTWKAIDELYSRHETVIVVGAGQQFCHQAQKLVSECSAVPKGTSTGEYVVKPKGSLLPLLSAAGFPIRPI
jgi:hypothetical protein